MPKRILFVLTSHDRKGQAESKDAAPSGFYLSEVSHPYDVLTKEGYEIDFVRPAATSRRKAHAGNPLPHRRHAWRAYR
ncbi:hypothetical protein [Serratia marcescens]|uniref:hypothetical protein n=1 Tax=Serratia marcescens TaxID=615 RepID=UPI001FB676FC|nr:hypothetical protein [Serratia marcescens]